MMALTRALRGGLRPLARPSLRPVRRPAFACGRAVSAFAVWDAVQVNAVNPAKGMCLARESTRATVGDTPWSSLLLSALQSGAVGDAKELLTLLGRHCKGECAATDAATGAVDDADDDAEAHRVALRDWFCPRGAARVVHAVLVAPFWAPVLCARDLETLFAAYLHAGEPEQAATLMCRVAVVETADGAALRTALLQTLPEAAGEGSDHEPDAPPRADGGGLLGRETMLHELLTTCVCTEQTGLAVWAWRDSLQRNPHLAEQRADLYRLYLRALLKGGVAGYVHDIMMEVFGPAGAVTEVPDPQDVGAVADAPSQEHDRQLPDQEADWFSTQVGFSDRSTTHPTLEGGDGAPLNAFSGLILPPGFSFLSAKSMQEEGSASDSLPPQEILHARFHTVLEEAAHVGAVECIPALWEKWNLLCFSPVPAFAWSLGVAAYANAGMPDLALTMLHDMERAAKNKVLWSAKPDYLTNNYLLARIGGTTADLAWEEAITFEQRKEFYRKMGAAVDMKNSALDDLEPELLNIIRNEKAKLPQHIRDAERSETHHVPRWNLDPPSAEDVLSVIRGVRASSDLYPDAGAVQRLLHECLRRLSKVANEALTTADKDFLHVYALARSGLLDDARDHVKALEDVDLQQRARQQLISGLADAGEVGAVRSALEADLRTTDLVARFLSRRSAWGQLIAAFCASHDIAAAEHTVLALASRGAMIAPELSVAVVRGYADSNRVSDAEHFVSQLGLRNQSAATLCAACEELSNVYRRKYSTYRSAALMRRMERDLGVKPSLALLHSAMRALGEAVLRDQQQRRQAKASSDTSAQLERELQNHVLQLLRKFPQYGYAPTTETYEIINQCTPMSTDG